ncbi:hypothetical protein PC128_g26140 [Phytophthora cactorum]|nr:hypothetical protein PC128_g26140 [Phytophthora cactorum]
MDRQSRLSTRSYAAAASSSAAAEVVGLPVRLRCNVNACDSAGQVLEVIAYV